MPSPKIGNRAPAFNLPATSEQKIALKNLKGHYVVLYFYPKDSTPGCTTEGQDFSEHYEAFNSLGAVILGISKDSIASHEKFKAKHAFPFDLLSDENEEICQKYDVIKLKKMYGKEFMGVERSTFLIDPEGKLVAEWRKVRVKGHVEAVLNTLTEITQS
ncbi:MAG: peroxiredoxin [Pseudomonadota bacterium]